MSADTPTQRSTQIDAIRGVLIIAVVLSHTMRGLFAADIIDPRGIWIDIDEFLYLIHMPLFAALVGVMIPRSVMKRGPGPYLVERGEWITYVYLLWTLIMGAVSIATSALKNVAEPWYVVLNPLLPNGHLWFMPFLLLATVTVVLLGVWQSRLRAVVGCALTGILSALTWGWGPAVIFCTGLALIFFVALGALVDPPRLDAILNRVQPWAMLVAGLAGLAGIAALVYVAAPLYPSANAPTRDWPSILQGMAGTAIGSAGVIAAVSGLSRLAPRLGGRLAYLGRCSLYIYLAHILFTAGTRIALGIAGLNAPWLQLTVGLAAGVIGPLILWELSRRWAPWLFAVPWRNQP